MFDCSKTSETIKSNDNLPRQKHSRFKYWQHHVRQISQHVFNKLIKSHDRLSIIKFNCEIYLETTCNLTLKEANELMLLKELTHATKAKQMSGKTELGCVLDKVIARVCGLRS